MIVTSRAVSARTVRRSDAIDVLRGLSIVLMVFVNLPGEFAVTPTPLRHAPWEGLRLADLVFPGFLVAAGAALAFGSRVGRVGPSFVRAARLFALGLALVWIGARDVSVESGTLQFIAVCWLLGSLSMRLAESWRVAVALGVLVAVAALHAGDWGPARTIDTTIDSWVFGERSELGVLAMVSGGAMVALASVASARVNRANDLVGRVGVLVVGGLVAGLGGAAFVAAGVPIVKRLWSPSFVLVTLAMCLATWAVLEWIATLPGAAAPLAPFVALGRNALAAYVVVSLVDSLVPESWARGFVDALSPPLAPAIASMTWSALIAVALTAAAVALRRRNVTIRL